MPPKKGVFIPKNRRGKDSATPTGGDTPTAEEGTGTPLVEKEEDASTLTTGVEKLSVADDSSSVATSGTAGVSVAPIPKLAGDDDLDQDEQARRLIAEALEKATVTTSTYASKIAPGSRDIKVEGLTVILNGKVLFEEATLALNYGNRYGLVGANGCGK
jgi:hypothetical protein